MGLQLRDNCTRRRMADLSFCRAAAYSFGVEPWDSGRQFGSQAACGGGGLHGSMGKACFRVPEASEYPLHITLNELRLPGICG